MDNYKLTIISQMIMRDVKEMFEEMSEWVSDCCLMQTQKIFIYILTKMLKWIWFRQINLATGYQRPRGFGSGKLALQRATNDHVDLVQIN
jgi:hypothetical protein